MATKVTHPVNFDSTRSIKLNWDELFDGDTWELVKGVDYNGSSKNFPGRVRYEAKKRGIVVNTKYEDDRVYLQAIVKTKDAPTEPQSASRSKK